MSRKKAAVTTGASEDEMRRSIRAISSAVRQGLSGSLCPNEQAEYDRRLAEDTRESEPP